MFNLFDVPHEFSDETTDILYESGGTRIERIVSNGSSSPSGFWYDQDEDEWVSVIQGGAEIEFEDKVITLKTGDTLLIKAHQRHRVKSTSKEPKCIWLCVFQAV